MEQIAATAIQRFLPRFIMRLSKATQQTKELLLRGGRPS